jgi:hypothetical protein
MRNKIIATIDTTSAVFEIYGCKKSLFEIDYA